MNGCILLAAAPGASEECMDETIIAGPKASNFEGVAPSDIISNLFLEDLERIWELKKWIPDPCNPYFHYLKAEQKNDNRP